MNYINLNVNLRINTNHIKNALSLLVIALIFLGLIRSFNGVKPEILVDENRAATKFPVFNKGDVANYFKQIDDFAKDNFPRREKAIKLYRKIVALANDNLNAGQAFRGKDGFLFIGNNFNQTIDKLEGKLTPNPEISYINFRMIPLAKWFQEQGTQVVFVLGSNKNSVYFDKLPINIKPATKRYTDPYLEKVRQEGFMMIDPTAALIKHKEQEFVFYKEDTHWNKIGASIAFNQTMHALGINNCSNFSFAQDADKEGDLINIGLFKKSKAIKNDNFKVIWHDASDIKDFAVADVESGKNHRFFHNDKASVKQSVFVLGDSVRLNFLPFAVKCFADVASVHFFVNSDEEIKQAFNDLAIKPSLVIIMMTERTFSAN